MIMEKANCLYLLYQILNKFSLNEEQPTTDTLDTISEYILKNNACRFSYDTTCYKVRIDEDYFIYFVYGAIGNEINVCYDYIEYKRIKRLIIFADVFDRYINNTIEEDPIGILGKSIYFEYFKKIFEVFILTYYPNYSQIPLTTAARSLYDKSPIYLTAKIINNKYGLEPEDQEYMRYKEIKHIVDEYSAELLCAGIYNIENI